MLASEVFEALSSRFKASLLTISSNLICGLSGAVSINCLPEIVADFFGREDIKLIDCLASLFAVDITKSEDGITRSTSFLTKLIFSSIKALGFSR